ncbi:hypothetical protein BABINDRAFT_182737 [Babjeviella inositovora NRRL Y-12698]|uniref:TOG domain-containing protein n=1 Tax=Babjeviella inositovora NRRL Y-12698 TaxID=984486 RepID=A0A1E3QXA2_9ASCO|nr:uncharacterized protein BABINDRAFT_182737 [Babjeviella inositovora NRRL Y-12698]ODQ81637.1 hypothetical protein BABINDRAFT_182737 [Babjeviella inositovora NRRL Y-12698]
MSDEDYSGLPLEERIIHKVWKVRLGAYEEIDKQFAASANEQSDCFQLFLKNGDLFGKIVTDSNVVAQEAGIQALCTFLEYGGTPACTRIRGRTVGPLIEKGLASSRAGTKQKTINALLMFVELDTPELIVDEILPFLSARLPKLVATATKALAEIYVQFGAKAVSPKTVIPAIPKLFSHADKTVRAEATLLTVEIYKWMGVTLETVVFPDLKPVQQKDLKKAFEAVTKAPVQLRLLRSQKEALEGLSEAHGDVSMHDAEEDVDPFDMIEAKNVLAAMPADLHERINSTKWKDRKEVLEEVHVVVNTPKVADGDYTDLARILAKCMKDANVQVVQLAANCTEFLARALRTKFARYLNILLAPTLERTKEKKLSVTEALAGALDALFQCSSLSDILEETIVFSRHKTPQVKIEATKYLARCLKNTTVSPKRAEVELIMTDIVKLLSDSQEPVRAAASDAIGTLMKITGERELNAYLEKVDDNRKSKIQQVFEAVEVKCKFSTGPAKLVKPASAVRTTAATRLVRKAEEPIGTRKSVTGSIPTKRGATSPLKRDEAAAQKPAAARSGLTGRILTTAPALPPPRFEVSNPRDKEELEDLRAEKNAWLKERELAQWQKQEFATEKSRLMQEIDSLQLRNEKLMEEHTHDVLAIKSKDTQLIRANNELDEIRSAMLRLQKENAVLKTRSEAGHPAEQGHPSEAVDLSSRVSGLSIDGHNPYEQRENKFASRDYPKQPLEVDTNDDSWRRAAEVTSQLKARIEKMKARSRSNISSF